MLLDLTRIDVSQCSFIRANTLQIALVNRFYTQCQYKAKSGRFEHVYYLEAKGQILVAARLIPQRSGHFLLRNLCTLPAARHQGLASYFTGLLMAQLAPQHCYCFALPHLEAFYRGLGFMHMDADAVPHDIADMHHRHISRKRGWLLLGYTHHTKGS